MFKLINANDLLVYLFTGGRYGRSQPQYVAEWLSTYAKANTRGVFRASVRHFLESVYGSTHNNGELESYA